MAEPTGGDFNIIKLIPEKVVEKVYDDAASGSMVQVGKIAEDTAKTARLVLFPLQLLGKMQDRFENWMRKIGERVPEERRTEAPPSIAGPVIERLKWTEENSPIQEMYLNLLARAVDRERRAEAHPAYIRIIEQMSPSEAYVFWRFAKQPDFSCFSMRGTNVLSGYLTRTLPPEVRIDERLMIDFRLLCNYAALVNAVYHLDSLGLLDARFDGPDRYEVSVTGFGREFGKSCLPEEMPMPI